MMKEPEREIRLTGYKSYLQFKHIIDVIRENPSSRREIADKLNIHISNTWHVMRVLVKCNVVKRVRYDIDDKGKRAVYGLVKDE